jgi:hypothetical protein
VDCLGFGSERAKVLEQLPRCYKLAFGYWRTPQFRHRIERVERAEYRDRLFLGGSAIARADRDDESRSPEWHIFRLRRDVSRRIIMCVIWPVSQTCKLVLSLRQSTRNFLLLVLVEFHGLEFWLARVASGHRLPDANVPRIRHWPRPNARNQRRGDADRLSSLDLRSSLLRLDLPRARWRIARPVRKEGPRVSERSDSSKVSCADTPTTALAWLERSAAAQAPLKILVHAQFLSHNDA